MKKESPSLLLLFRLLHQNLKFTPSKPCSKPAQATAAPGLHDQHLTVDAEAALTQVPTFDCPNIGGGYPDPGNGFKVNAQCHRKSSQAG